MKDTTSPPDISIKQLRTLVAVAEHESVSRAAIAKNIAQSALSRQLLELERSFRTKLFYRHGRGVSLTDAGMLLLKHAQSVLQALDRSVLEMEKLNSNDVSGVVHLGIPPSLTDMLAARLILKLKSSHPNLNLHIVEGFSGNLLEWLANGTLDLCMLYNAPNVRSAICRPLWTEDICLVEKARDKDAPPPPTIKFAEAARKPLILPGPKHGLRTVVANACASAGVQLNIQLEIDVLGAIRDLVEADLGCALQPQVAVQRQLERGAVTVQRVVEPELIRTLYMVVPAISAMSRASETIVSLLRAEMMALAEEGRWGSRAHFVQS